VYLQAIGAIDLQASAFFTRQMCSREAIKTFVGITYHNSKSDAHKGKVTYFPGTILPRTTGIRSIDVTSPNNCQTATVKEIDNIIGQLEKDSIWKVLCITTCMLIST
jgi:hypothetical protein